MRRFLAQPVLRIFCMMLVCAAEPGLARAQASAASEQALDQDSPQSAQPDQTGTQSGAPAPPDSSAGDSSNSDTLTLFPHSETSRYWISGQANIVLQWHGAFPAKYSGPNSLRPEPENGTSKVYTLYLGYELSPTTEVFLDMESAGGHGLSNALGLAGITNLDVVRNTTLSQDPYVARLMLRQVIPLSDERVEAERDELHLATSLPARRIEFRFGKFDLADFFDLNTWGSDSHLQFLNWTVDNNGAYDYAANTRGYTDAVLLEYDDHWWTARFAEALMPKVANGIHLDADVARARAENLEQPRRYGQLPRRSCRLSRPRDAHAGHHLDTPSGTPQIRLRAELRAADHITDRRLRPPRLERRPQRIVRLHRG
jgi:hypothetical protein